MTTKHGLAALGLVVVAACTRSESRSAAPAPRVPVAPLRDAGVARVAVSPDAAPASVDAGGVELVVVFAHGVTPAAAEALLAAQGFPFHEGSDSSRGKGYFYANGPQYLVRVPAGAQAGFEAALKRPEVHEIYAADWSTQKD